MARTIYKYDVHIADRAEILMPKGAEFLSWQYNHGTDCCAVWFLVDRSAEDEWVKFRIFGTGHSLPDSGIKYLGTAIDKDAFVWHLFEDQS